MEYLCVGAIFSIAFCAAALFVGSMIASRNARRKREQEETAYRNAVDLCKSKLRESNSADELIGFLKTEGYNILLTIKIVREVLDISLGDAKKLVTAHAAWQTEAEQMDMLHTELLAEFEENPPK